MSKIDRTYFKFNPAPLDLTINLGDSKEFLLSKGLIKTKYYENEVYFMVTDGTSYRIEFTNEKVSKIWFGHESTFSINGKNILGENYRSVLTLLEDNFEPFNSTISSVEEMKKHTNSPILCVICRDFFISSIGIIDYSAH